MAETLQTSEVQQEEVRTMQEEGKEPPVKVARIETPIRPLGMPPMMPWMPSGESGVTLATAPASIVASGTSTAAASSSSSCTKLFT